MLILSKERIICQPPSICFDIPPEQGKLKNICCDCLEGTVQNFIADRAGFLVSYAVPACVFAYLILYSLKLSKVK